MENAGLWHGKWHFMMVYDTFLIMENQYMNPNDISENYMRNISRNLKDPSSVWG